MPAFLKALIPNTVRRAPIALLEAEEVKSAIAALNGRKDLIGNVKTAPINEAIEMLQEPGQLRKAMRIFDESCNAYRNELYLTADDNNPMRRLALHETLMATGYYARAANMHNPKLDPVRFVVNHYNFDMRRDSILVDRMRRAILSSSEEETTENAAVANEILQLERYLFGAQRLRPVEGKQYLCLGVPMTELKDDKMLQAALSLPAVETYGNFTVDHHSDVRSFNKGNTRRSTSMQERWMVATVGCGSEPEMDPLNPRVPAVFSSELMEANRDTWLSRKFEYNIRYLLPAPIIPWAERVREFLLNAWVYFFGGWVFFWMFDEELIAIFSIAYTRYSAKRILKEEARMTGGRIYMMQSKFH